MLNFCYPLKYEPVILNLVVFGYFFVISPIVEMTAWRAYNLNQYIKKKSPVKPGI